MRTVAKIGLASTLLLGTAHAAFAGVITQTATYSASAFTNQALNFAGYNPGAGNKLDSVTITATDNLTGSVQETYNPAPGTTTNQTGSQTYGDLSTISLPGGGQILQANQAYTLAVDLAPGASTPLENIDHTVTSSPYSATNLGLFESSWTALASDSGTTSGAFSPNVEQLNLTTTDTVTVTATYTYSANPPPSVMEPTSMAILASGLLGVGMIRRRRRG